MNSKKQRITMVEVAKLAGVSQSTVSFVLNNSPIAISEDTKQRIFEAVHQLNFVPRAKIQNYKKVSDNIIAILVPNISNLFYPLLVKQIDKYAKAKGYCTIIVNTNRDVENEQSFFKLLIDMKVAGIIYCFTPNLNDINKIKALNIPLMVIGETHEDFNIDSVNLNSFVAGEILGNHLLELGHNNIVFITSPIEVVSLSRKRRLQGLTSVLRGKAKLEIITDSHEYELDNANYETELGYNETIKLFKYIKGINPSAIVGANDMIAFGVIKALNELNIKVPDDVSVAGFDNISITELIFPPLTTMDHCIDHRARLAIDLLDDKIAKKSTLPVKVNYEPVLIKRLSTSHIKSALFNP